MEPELSSYIYNMYIVNEKKVIVFFVLFGSIRQMSQAEVPIPFLFCIAINNNYYIEFYLPFRLLFRN